MDFGIIGIGELLKNDAVRDLLVQFLGLGNGTLHALWPFGENQLGPENLEELAALKGHRLGHGEDELETLGGGNEGQRDAGVAGSRLDQNGVLVDAAGLQGLLDHGVADTVFDGGERVEKFQLEQHFRLRVVSGGGAIETDERGVTDGLGDVVVDAGHNISLVNELRVLTMRKLRGK